MDLSKKRNSHLVIIALFVIIALILRFIPLWYPNSYLLFNLSPLGAIALFGGAYIRDKKWAFILPIGLIWISDIVINNVFYAQYFDGFTLFGDLSVYAALAVLVILGLVFLQKRSPIRIGITAIVGSILFFLGTNFAVWMSGLMYPKTWAGLLECYTLAVPFFKNTLAGNLLFSALMFGLYEYVVSRQPSLSLFHKTLKVN